MSIILARQGKQQSLEILKQALLLWMWPSINDQQRQHIMSHMQSLYEHSGGLYVSMRMDIFSSLDETKFTISISRKMSPDGTPKSN